MYLLGSVVKCFDLKSTSSTWHYSASRGPPHDSHLFTDLLSYIIYTVVFKVN